MAGQTFTLEPISGQPNLVDPVTIESAAWTVVHTVGAGQYDKVSLKVRNNFGNWTAGLLELRLNDNDTNYRTLDTFEVPNDAEYYQLNGEVESALLQPGVKLEARISNYAAMTDFVDAGGTGLQFHRYYDESGDTVYFVDADDQDVDLFNMVYPSEIDFTGEYMHNIIVDGAAGLVIWVWDDWVYSFELNTGLFVEKVAWSGVPKGEQYMGRILTSTAAKCIWTVTDSGYVDRISWASGSLSLTSYTTNIGVSYEVKGCIDPNGVFITRGSTNPYWRAWAPEESDDLTTYIDSDSNGGNVQSGLTYCDRGGGQHYIVANGHHHSSANDPYRMEWDPSTRTFGTQVSATGTNPTYLGCTFYDATEDMVFALKMAASGNACYFDMSTTFDCVDAPTMQDTGAMTTYAEPWLDDTGLWQVSHGEGGDAFLVFDPVAKKLYSNYTLETDPLDTLSVQSIVKMASWDSAAGRYLIIESGNVRMYDLSWVQKGSKLSGNDWQCATHDNSESVIVVSKTSGDHTNRYEILTYDKDFALASTYTDTDTNIEYCNPIISGNKLYCKDYGDGDVIHVLDVNASTGAVTYDRVIDLSSISMNIHWGMAIDRTLNNLWILSYNSYTGWTKVDLDASDALTTITSGVSDTPDLYSSPQGWGWIDGHPRYLVDNDNHFFQRGNGYCEYYTYAGTGTAMVDRGSWYAGSAQPYQCQFHIDWTNSRVCFTASSSYAKWKSFDEGVGWTGSETEMDTDNQHTGMPFWDVPNEKVIVSNSYPYSTIYQGVTIYSAYLAGGFHPGSYDPPYPTGVHSSQSNYRAWNSDPSVLATDAQLVTLQGAENFGLLGSVNRAENV